MGMSLCVQHGMSLCVQHGMSLCVQHGMSLCVQHGMSLCVQHGIHQGMSLCVCSTVYIQALKIAVHCPLQLSIPDNPVHMPHVTQHCT